MAPGCLVADEAPPPQLVVADVTAAKNTTRTMLFLTIPRRVVIACYSGTTLHLGYRAPAVLRRRCPDHQVMFGLVAAVHYRRYRNEVSATGLAKRPEGYQ